MKTLKEVKDRCRVSDTGCWIWAGAQSVDGYPRIYAPDHTGADGAMRSQTGRRAVWHITKGRAVPQGWRVFGTCDDPCCLNPAHACCQPVAERGAVVAASGQWRGVAKRIIASRIGGRKRSSLTPEMISHIKTSPKNGVEVARELGVSRSHVSRVRNGKALCFEPVGGLFTGLMAANDQQRARA